MSASATPSWRTQLRRALGAGLAELERGVDRLVLSVAPSYGASRIRTRSAALLARRHFDAAGNGRRTSGWQRPAGDANTANRAGATVLRELSRDILRNNGWGIRGVETICNNVVGWGIMPRANNRSQARSDAALALWESWATSTRCDFDGRVNLYGLQRLVMKTIVESGEALVIRQPASLEDGLAVPIRLQVLEPDYLDASKNGDLGEGRGKIVDGVEFDAQGRRVAYWLFSEHPGGQRVRRFESTRVSASRVLHCYRVDRPGQVRGVPWLAASIPRLNDLDDFEDAELMRMKIAASFGAFVTDVSGEANAIGELVNGSEGGESGEGEELEELEPGSIKYLQPGEQITFPSLPNVTDAAFATRTLRRIAAGMNVTYEDLTGDYSQVNYSSARMARLAHWQGVHVWREHMILPQFCQGVWAWFVELAGALNGWTSNPSASWSAPPMPILDPEKEGTAYQRLVRTGAMTWPQMVRELGEDPEAQLDEIEATNAEFDRRGIVLDVDPRKMSAGGQQQTAPASSTGSADAAADKAAPP